MWSSIKRFKRVYVYSPLLSMVYLNIPYVNIMNLTITLLNVIVIWMLLIRHFVENNGYKGATEGHK